MAADKHKVAVQAEARQRCENVGWMSWEILGIVRKSIGHEWYDSVCLRSADGRRYTRVSSSYLPESNGIVYINQELGDDCPCGICTSEGYRRMFGEDGKFWDYIQYLNSLGPQRPPRLSRIRSILRKVFQ